MNNTRRQRVRGLTLIEVLAALAIMALVAALAAQAFFTASSGAEATQEAMQRMARIDRTFVLIENDLRNALPRVVQEPMGQPLPPLVVSEVDDYRLVIMRGGLANPLNQPRTEDVRVGYRYQDETIWRDTWINPAQNEQHQARARKLLEEVTSMRFRVLSPQATSLAAGPWLNEWPQRGGGVPMDTLPLAIEITFELEDMGEIVRLFSLLPGHVPTVPGAN